MMRDLGYAVKPVLNTDAKATEHVLHRREDREAEART